MLYRNCRELPMHNFNEIDITGDLTYLIKENKKYKEAELERHWIDILDEFFVLSEDNYSKKFFRDRAKLIYFELQLKILTLFKKIIEKEEINEEDKRVIEICSLCKVSNLSQGILEINDKVNILISRLKKDNDKEKNSNFDKELAIMRMNGYHVDRHSVTVSEWIELKNQIKNQTLNGRQKK